jgi:hypothetical protein
MGLGPWIEGHDQEPQPHVIQAVLAAGSAYATKLTDWAHRSCTDEGCLMWRLEAAHADFPRCLCYRCWFVFSFWVRIRVLVGVPVGHLLLHDGKVITGKGKESLTASHRYQGTLSVVGIAACWPKEGIPIPTYSSRATDRPIPISDN